jgi:hypothetical protein
VYDEEDLESKLEGFAEERDAFFAGLELANAAAKEEEGKKKKDEGGRRNK